MKEFLETKIITIGQTSITIEAVLLLVLFIIGVIIFMMVIKKIIYSTSKFDISKKVIIYSLIKYFVIVLSIIIGFKILRFDISLLIAGSAALLVGIGLGLQNIFSDFFSGFILLLDSSIKVNDIIEVNGLVCKVNKINFRTTTVLTRDDKYIILPNTELTRNRIINWTHSSITSRFELNVSVDYASDVNLVLKIMKDVALEHPMVLKSPEPFVRFTDYGDSALEFAVFFHCDEIFRVENIKSEIRIRLYEEFKKHGIHIPFPQRVVHFKNRPSESSPPEVP